MFSWISFFSQDMLYQSLKFTNGIWVLAELKMQPGNPVVQVSDPGAVHFTFLLLETVQTVALKGSFNQSNWPLKSLF